MPTSVSLESLEPGMILAEPVTNTLGQTLINSGIELNQRHISVLRTWNIQFVRVLTDETEDITDISENHIQKARVELSHIIKWSPRNDAESDLIELGVLALAHRIKEVADD